MRKGDYAYGAWEDQKITFAKAVAMADHNEKMRNYLNFSLGKFGGNPCKTQDLGHRFGYGS